MSDETIFTTEDVIKMLDSLLREPKSWWNNFYSDRNKKVPIFVNAPDENLIQYIDNKQIKTG